jgi:putative redox protein
MQEHVIEAKAVLAKWSSISGASACYLEFRQDHWMADIDGADRRHATPHEILDAALASCTALSLQLYVKHKGWRISRIGVAVAHTHAQDAYRLERRISVEGDLTAEQRAALLRVVQACPVYKTLTGDIAINTSVASDSREPVASAPD